MNDRKKEFYFKKRCTFAKFLTNHIGLTKTGKYCLGIFIVLMNLNVAIFAQTAFIKEDVVNKYAKVTGISGSTVTLSMDVSSMFAKNDTVLLIQMTGIPVDGGEINNAGRYEFHIISNVNNQTVTLLSLPGNFNPTELVQLIRVPSYKNVEITENQTLTCMPWDWKAGTGGVLALMVKGTLTFNGNIDVSGLGFKGGEPSGEYTGACSFDPPYNQADYQANFSDRAGNKGEGAVTTSYFNPGVSNIAIRGYGKTWNGGGGGNGKWSGGGGGGNGGYGGYGGNQSCGLVGSGRVHLDNPPRDIFNNGYLFKYDDEGWFPPSKHAFMGGGGGAGTGVGTAGGNGGGLVIIVARKLQFSGNNAIKANGASVGGAPREAGAGGGGAGGSVFLSAEDFENIKVEIRGGNGGNVDRVNCSVNTYSRGAGGGGSGGALFTSRNINTANVLITGGNTGQLTVCYGDEATDGDIGIHRDNFQVQIRGFLFNYIITPDTTVCYGDAFNNPLTIRASKPLGGNGNYICQWQTSLDGVNKWEDIENNDPYQLTRKFIQDIFVRRVVSSGNIIDEGLPVRIKVTQLVTNDIAPKDTAMCGRESFLFRGSVSTGGGNGDYSYQWQEFKNNGWTNIADNATGKDYRAIWPTDNTIKTYRYRRIVTSKPIGCVSIVETSDITVHPDINNNTIALWDQEENPAVCSETAGRITGELPNGGTGAYDYRWKVSVDGKNWYDIDNQQNYTPYLNETSNISQSEYYSDRSYRRQIVSGKCESTSNEVTLHFIKQLLPAIIRTNEKTGEDALKFQFSIALDADAPTSGTGEWTSGGELIFNPPDKPNTTVNNLQFGENIIYWTVSNVCDHFSTSIRIEVVDIKIPTGFSPNGDAYNQCFRIIGAENALSSELIVFDRYNNIVFESKSFKGNSDLNNCEGWWDGRNSSGKELPSGVYFYQFTLNGDKVYKGYVALKR